jgi:hypothetical protein
MMAIRVAVVNNFNSLTFLGIAACSRLDRSDRIFSTNGPAKENSEPHDEPHDGSPSRFTVSDFLS